jgi:hypothetical protein
MMLQNYIIFENNNLEFASTRLQNNNELILTTLLCKNGKYMTWEFSKNR